MTLPDPSATNTPSRIPRWAIAGLCATLLPACLGVAAALCDEYCCWGYATLSVAVMGILAAVFLVVGVPLAAIHAVVCCRRIRASGGSRPGKGIAIATLVLALLNAAVVAVAIPSVMTARRVAQRNTCWGVMSCVDAAKEQLALEKNRKDGDAVSAEELADYLGGGVRRMVCPYTGRNTYTIGRIGESPRCSYHGSLAEMQERNARRESR